MTLSWRCSDEDNVDLWILTPACTCCQAGQVTIMCTLTADGLSRGVVWGDPLKIMSGV